MQLGTLPAMTLATSQRRVATWARVLASFRHRVLLPDAKQHFMMLWGTVAFGLTAINYYTLVSGRKWSRFEPEFQHVSKATRLLGGFLVWESIILVVATAEWMALVARKLPG
jgi:hypothetical protein